jgi:hypothetical protein
MKTIITLITLVLCGNAFARLNETLDQCVARYGEPLKKSADGRVMSWHKQGIAIVAAFHDATCEQIEYFKINSGGEATSERFTDAELTQLQEINGKQWRPRLHLIHDAWDGGDGAVMMYFSFTRNIVISTAERLRRDQAATEKRQEAKKAAAEQAAREKLKGL